MAQLLIQYLRHPETGDKLFRISLASDEDATPREHEQDHRRLVASLLPGVDLDGCNPAHVVERERPAREPMMMPSSDDDGYEVIDLG